MAATTLLTSDQFLALPEEFDQHGNRIKDELIGGEVVKMPPASYFTTRSRIDISELLIRVSSMRIRARLRSALVEIGAQVSDVRCIHP